MTNKIRVDNKLTQKKFLKDVITLAFSAFGGPQAHIAMFFDVLVSKKNYLSEEELIELQAFCSILPGPTSTQTITSIGYKLGGIKLACLTLLLWVTPAFLGMLTIGLTVNYLTNISIDLSFTKYLQLVAIGIIIYAAYNICKKVIIKKYQWLMMLFGSIISTIMIIKFTGESFVPFVFPLLLISGGIFTSVLEKKDLNQSHPFKIKWKYGIFFILFLIFSMIGGSHSSYVHLLDIFYRNGSFVYGGGQVLIPLLQTEFVETEKLMTNEQFLTGFGMVNSLPGPVFSLSGYLGTVSMQSQSFLLQIIGGCIGVIGIFLPGTLLIFFIYPIWDVAKKNQSIKNSLIGINAIASGLIVSACFLLSLGVSKSFLNLSDYILGGSIIFGTVIILHKKLIPSPILIGVALVLGIIFQN